MRNTLMLFAAVGAMVMVSSAAAAQTFPDGPGKDILETECSTCHGPEMVRTGGRSAEEWHDVILEMSDLGARITDEQLPVLVEYLAKNFPRKGSAGSPAADANSATQAPSAQGGGVPAAADSAQGSTVGTGTQGVTVIGCLQGDAARGYVLAVAPSGAGSGTAAIGSGPMNGNGAANAAGATTGGAATAPTTYMVTMAAGGTDLAKLVGQRVEVVGTVAPPSGAASTAGSNSSPGATGGGSTATGASGTPPAGNSGTPAGNTAAGAAASSSSIPALMLTAKTVHPVEGSCGQ